MNIKNPPDWLPEIPGFEAIIVIRLIGVFTLVFMFIMLEPLFIRLYLNYFR